MTNPPHSISELTIIEIDKKGTSHLAEIKALISEGHSFGIISESGMPGVADPGSSVVQLAHDLGCIVKPLVGPSSILLALAASGLNGQSFCFHGYLPIKEYELKKKLKSLESNIKKSNQTQIFIETPYRNDRLLDLICKTIQQQLTLCIARDITGREESVQSKKISDWNNSGASIGKLPAIFLLGF